MPAGAPIAFLPAAGCPPDYGESFLARYADLGAPPGYVVPVYDTDAARDRANARLLSEAGLIYIGGGDTRLLLNALTGTPALEALAAAYKAGAVIAGMSAGAIALAAWGLSIDSRVGVLQGWGWLPDVIVAPHYTPERSCALTAALRDRPQTIGLGIAEHVALALGPSGEVQHWGPGQISVIGPELRERA